MSDFEKAIVDAKRSEIVGIPDASTPAVRQVHSITTTDDYKERRKRIQAVAQPRQRAPSEMLEGWLDRAPPAAPSTRALELRRMAKEHAAARSASGGVHVSVKSGQLDRMASLVQREVGDLLEAAGFIWTPAQQKQIETQIREWMTTTAFYDGLVYRPVKEVVGVGE